MKFPGGEDLVLYRYEGESWSILSDSLRPHGLYNPWNSPGQNTGVGSHSLLQGIFPTQKLNQGLLHCRQILYQLSNQGSPYIGIPADSVLDGRFIGIYCMMKGRKRDREKERKEGRKKKRQLLMEQLWECITHWELWLNQFHVLGFHKRKRGMKEGQKEGRRESGLDK